MSNKFIPKPLMLIAIYWLSGILGLVALSLISGINSAYLQIFVTLVFFGFSTAALFAALRQNIKTAPVEVEIQNNSIQKTGLQNNSAITLNSSLAIISAGSGIEVLSGYKFNELLNKPFTRLVPDPIFQNNSALTAFWHQQKNNVANIESTLITSNGELIPVQVTINKPGSENDSYFSLNLKDISLKKEHENIINANEFKFNKLIENSSNIYCYCDANAVISYVSPSVIKVLGYSIEEFTGINLFTLFKDQWFAKIQNAFYECVSLENKSIKAELEIKNKEGEIKLVQIELRNLLSYAPINSVCVIIQDITSLSHSKANLNAILENTDEAIWAVDNKNHIILANKMAQKIFYTFYNTELKKGNDFLSLIPTESRNEYQSIFERVKTGETLRIENTLEKNGSKYYFETNITPIYEDGIISGINHFMRDLTSKKEMEETIRNIASGLSSATGQQFFNSLAEYLCGSLDCQFVSIGKLVEYNGRNAIETISLLIENELSPNIIYDLENTPCSQAIENDKCFISEKTYSYFAEDEFLVSLKTEGYIGVVLKNSQGKVMGVMALGTKNPIAKKQWAESIFTIFAARAAAELERVMAVEALLHSNANLEALIENTDESIWFLDRNFTILITNSTFKKVFTGIFDVIPQVGMNYLDCIPEEGRESFTNIFNRALNGERMILERTFYLDGTPHFFDMCVNPISIKNEIIGVSYFVKDVTERQIAANKIRSSEEKYRNLIENMAEGVVYFDPSGRMVFANDQFYNMIGYAPGSSFDDDLGEILSIKDIALMQNQVSAGKSGQPQTFEMQLLCKNGNRIWASVNAVPLFDDFSEFSGMLCTISDITDKKITLDSIKRSELKYRTLVNTMKEGMVQVNMDSAITFVNRRFCEISGYNENELLGRPAFDFLISDDEKDLIKENLELRNKRISSQYEAQFTNKFGERLWVMVTGSPLYNENGQVVGSIVTMSDISELKNTEENLRNINQELNTFVYKSSHDLKGPLASIIGLTDLACNEVEDKVAKNYLNLINQGANKLQQTLIDLLDTIKVKEGKVLYTPINFSELFTDILTSLEHSPGYNRLNFGISIEEKLQFVSDKKILQSVIQNLVDNAIKYQDFSKETLNVDVKISSYSPDKIKIDICDNGMGIINEAQPKIFDMFYRASQDSRGTGLGLYIVKKAVERLGGSISFSSKEGYGTTFSLILPCAEVEDELEEKLQVQEADSIQ